ncbi:hypothetical protein NA57DRAFT_33144, partial [Rhizodiscina lignyota]
VHSLDDRVKIPELVKALREIFEEYGTILDIVAKKSLHRKGQAFVVFKDVESATQAIEDVNGFELFGKKMELEYARTKSDKIVEKENPEQLEEHKRARIADRERREAAGIKRPGDPAGAGAHPNKAARGAKPAGGAGLIPDEYLPPNKVLFVQNIPDSYDVDALTVIFSRFEGFQEVRVVPNRPGIAFVEYDGIDGAISAKERTTGMPLGEQARPIKVTFQRQI